MSIACNGDSYALLNLGRTSDEQYNTWYGVKAHMKTGISMPTGPIVSLYGYSDASNTTNASYPINTVIGVFGRSYMSDASYSYFSAGVAGVANYHGGVGVYGATNTSSSYSFPTTSPGTYAGYFSGCVRVTATLTAAYISTTSDSRLKENIRDLNGSAASDLRLLRPVEYKLKSNSAQYVYEENAPEVKANHYGLVAQEVQEIFPNLVYEGSDGYLSINYLELIPILIKSVQDLTREVDDLKARLNELQ